MITYPLSHKLVLHCVYLRPTDIPPPIPEEPNGSERRHVTYNDVIVKFKNRDQVGPSLSFLDLVLAVVHPLLVLNESCLWLGWIRCRRKLKLYNAVA